MSSNLRPEESGEVTLSLEKAQMYAFSFIPWDASVEEARGWLMGQIDPRRHGLSTADLGFICKVHAEDQLVQSWRVNEANRAAKAAQLN